MSYKINETITFEPNGDNGLKLENDNRRRYNIIILYLNIIVDSMIYITTFHILCRHAV